MIILKRKFVSSQTGPLKAMKVEMNGWTPGLTRTTLAICLQSSFNIFSVIFAIIFKMSVHLLCASFATADVDSGCLIRSL